MDIEITGRKVEITPDVRECVDGRLRPLAEDPFFKASSAAAVIEKSGSQYQVRCSMTCKGHVVMAKGENFDIKKAISQAGDRLEGQLADLRDKIVDHRTK